MFFYLWCQVGLDDEIRSPVGFVFFSPQDWSAADYCKRRWRCCQAPLSTAHYSVHVLATESEWRKETSPRLCICHCQPTTPIESMKPEGARDGHRQSIPADIKALIVGPIVSGLPSVGSTCSWRNFHSCPRGCMETEKSRSGPTNASAPCRPRHLCRHFAPFHSFPFTFSPFFPPSFKTDNGNGTPLSCTKNALFIKKFGPPWPRCKIYRMISCSLLLNISTSQTSMPFK